MKLMKSYSRAGPLILVWAGGLAKIKGVTGYLYRADR